MQKIEIIPSEAPELVSYVMKKIIAAIKAPNSEYVLESGIEYVKEIQGKYNSQEFVLRHIPKTKRGEQDKIYASYDNLEFTCNFNELRDDFYGIDLYINKKYIYDLNTGCYILRPNTPSFFDMALKWIKSRRR